MESCQNRTDRCRSAEQADRGARPEETRQVHSGAGAVSEFPGVKAQTGCREAVGERGAGANGDDHAPHYPESARFRRADSKAELPHQDCFIGQMNQGRMSLGVKRMSGNRIEKVELETAWKAG